MELRPSRPFCSAHARARREGPGHHKARFGSAHWGLDSRIHHDRGYPARGYRVAALPAGRVTIRFGADRLYFQAGAWFRPVGRDLVVATPPFGVVVPALPPGCATLRPGGSSDYHANGVDTPGHGGGGPTTMQPPAGSHL